MINCLDPLLIFQGTQSISNIFSLGMWIIRNRKFTQEQPKIHARVHYSISDVSIIHINLRYSADEGHQDPKDSAISVDQIAKFLQNWHSWNQLTATHQSRRKKKLRHIYHKKGGRLRNDHNVHADDDIFDQRQH